MDQQTIERARTGHRAAIDALLRELQDPWYRLCLSLLRDPETARDAVQETALRFLKRLDGFRGESSLLTWSMGIAVNVVREMRRRRPTDSLDPDDEPLEGRTSGELQSHANVERNEMNAMIRAALNDLSDRQREVVVLRYFENLSTDETASAMQCAPGTIKATLHQALRKLRTTLNQLA